MRGWVIAVLFIAAAGISFDGGALAATYKFTDKSGNVGLADDLQSVPEEYRATAVLIGGTPNENAAAPETSALPAPQAVSSQPAAPEQPSAAVPAPEPESAPAPAAAPEPQEGMPFSIRLAISIGVVIASILVSVFLGKISAMHGHDKAIHILRMSLSWLVVVYLVAAHAKDVLIIFKATGHHVQSVSEESAKKGEKAAKAIKAMDALMKQAEDQAKENEKALQEAEKEPEK